MFEIATILYGMFVLPVLGLLGLMAFYVGIVFVPLFVFYGIGWVVSLLFGGGRE